jgi:hypothetical protein
MDDAPRKKTFAKKLQERIAASRFLSISLLLHAIIVILGGSVVLFKAYVEPSDFEAAGGVWLAMSRQVAAPPEENPNLSDQVFVQEQPVVNAPTIDTITSNATQTSFKMTSIPAPVKPMNTGDVTKAMADAAKAVAKGMGGGVPGSMSGRMGGTARAAAMKMTNGKEKSEKAVMAGLRWLKQHQNEDGSWAPENRPSMTGFAILCYLGHGELPDSPEFGPTVKEGTRLAPGERHGVPGQDVDDPRGMGRQRRRLRARDRYIRDVRVLLDDQGRAVR